MEDAFKEGRLLSFLCQYGIGACFLQMAEEIDTYPYFKLTVTETDDANPNYNDLDPATTGLVLDFRDLEFYETKPDYEPYGGIAFFKIDDRGLNLEWVVTPKTQIKTMTNPMSGTFRRAESMIVSSIYFKTVVGKHLVEIHMTFNLLEVALHNAFDYDLNKTFPRSTFNGHPIRLILYIHLFNHILAAELTVCHLVQEAAVFSQIWALTYDSLLNYITIQVSEWKNLLLIKLCAPLSFIICRISSPCSTTPSNMHLMKTGNTEKRPWRRCLMHRGVGAVISRASVARFNGN